MTADPQQARVTSSEALDPRRTGALEALTEILRLMEVPATVEAKDGPEGGLSLAVTLSPEFPGVAQGRRSPLSDALQFLLNKIVNRPGLERRWVAVGLGGHPEPRGPRTLRPSATASAPAPAARPSRVPEEPPPVEEPALTAAVRALAQRAAALGRFYALVGLSPEDRTRAVQATASIEGVRATQEGEGRLRRVVLTPARPTPMPTGASLPADVDALDEG